MRIGIIGTENSHGDHIIDHLNVQRLGGDARVIALSGGRSERNDALCAKGGIERIVDEPEELLDLVDAVIITDRHGGRHRAHAVPFLMRGMPVFVDKPLACTVEDAEAIIAAALAHDAPLTSSSAVRWVPDTEALAAEAAELGRPQTVITSGPADPASRYGGVFFYGIHAVDVAMRLAPGELGEVRVDRTADTIVATVPVGGIRVQINLVVQGSGRDVPFHAMVIGRHGIAARPLALGKSYVAPGLEAFLEMARTGKPPIGYGDLLRPIRILKTIAAALGPR